MIPDFKTYIKESVWSDIHKRSNGTAVRKEDEMDDIFDYLNNNYESVFNRIDKIKYENDKIIFPLFICPFLNSHCDLEISSTEYITFSTINPNKYIMTGISSAFKSTMKYLKPTLNNLYEKIYDNYLVIDVTEYSGLDHWIDFKIKPKDNSKITKQFCDEFINFIFDNIDKKLIRVTKKKQI